MSTPTPPSEFLYLFRGSGWDPSLSPAELQKAMAGFAAWFERLSADGTIRAGQPLMEEGCTLAKKDGCIVADGPYVESKEAVGGYLLVRAESMDEAIAMARQSPMLEQGITVEIRPIAAECPTMQRARTVLSREFAPAGI